MIIPALVFAFWAVACGEVKDEAVYKQAGDAHTTYGTMNEEPHYIGTESDYTPFDDEVSASTREVNELDNVEATEPFDGGPMENEKGERADDDGSIGYED